MATNWVKSFQCKSKAFEDVYIPNSKHFNHLLPSSTCTKTTQNLKDVVDTKTKIKPKLKPKSKSSSSSSCSKYQQLPKSTSKSEPSTIRVRSTASARHSRTSEPFFPTLTELPEGHPSRNVVEIIFHTSWSPKSFSGRIEMLFKVQNPVKTVSRFEEYREEVKLHAVSSRSGKKEEDGSRCMADGNEVMRFHCLGPTAGAVYDISGMFAFSGKDGGVCTFSGSGGAHENAGGGKGRRAMLVCRVIAGRVCKRRVGVESCRVGFDSVSGDNGELLVFDSRAVLPCFLIIYKL